MDPLWKLKSKKTHDDHDIGDDEDAEDRFIDVEEDDKDAKVWKLWKDKNEGKDKSEGKERKEGLTDLPWKLKDKKDGKKGAALWCVLFALTACRQDIHDLSTCSALIIAGRMLSLATDLCFRCAHASDVHTLQMRTRTKCARFKFLACLAGREPECFYGEGDYNEPCCNNECPKDGKSICDPKSNTCVRPCGDPGWPCCDWKPEDPCFKTAGHACIEGTCQPEPPSPPTPCGDPGWPCCAWKPEDPCFKARGHICKNGICKPKGALVHAQCQLMLAFRLLSRAFGWCLRSQHLVA